MNHKVKQETPADDRPALADEAETAQYIGDLVNQLERLARTHGLVSLQYQLRRCNEEARRIVDAASS
jgi:hypothetical protein